MLNISVWYLIVTGMLLISLFIGKISTKVKVYSRKNDPKNYWIIFLFFLVFYTILLIISYFSLGLNIGNILTIENIFFALIFIFFYWVLIFWFEKNFIRLDKLILENMGLRIKFYIIFFLIVEFFSLLEEGFNNHYLNFIIFLVIFSLLELNMNKIKSLFENNSSN